MADLLIVEKTKAKSTFKHRCAGLITALVRGPSLPTWLISRPDEASGSFSCVVAVMRLGEVPPDVSIARVHSSTHAVTPGCHVERAKRCFD